MLTKSIYMFFLRCRGFYKRCSAYTIATNVKSYEPGHKRSIYMYQDLTMLRLNLLHAVPHEWPPTSLQLEQPMGALGIARGRGLGLDQPQSGELVYNYDSKKWSRKQPRRYCFDIGELSFCDEYFLVRLLKTLRIMVERFWTFQTLFNIFVYGHSWSVKLNRNRLIIKPQHHFHLVNAEREPYCGYTGTCR